MDTSNISSAFGAFTASLATKALERRASDGYTLDSEGFYICPNCKTRASAYNEALGCMIPSECECRKAERLKREESERITSLEKRRVASFTASNMLESRFESDNGSNSRISDVMHRFVENFDEYRTVGRGILLFGKSGVGKSFFAGAVGNALIDRGYRVYQTSISRLESECAESYNKQSVIDGRIYTTDLIILDDFGAERQSDYMKEFSFRVINSLYEAKRSFFVTTNLSSAEIKKTSDADNVRIYQRIIERCVPIEVDGESQRVAGFAESFFRDKKVLGF